MSFDHRIDDGATAQQAMNNIKRLLADPELLMMEDDITNGSWRFAVEIRRVVIGAGPGGYVAAIRAAEMGQKVAIIEREYIGGVCLNVGCIPSKALIAAGHHYQESLDSTMFGVTSENVSLDFAKTQEWKDNKVVKTLTSGVGFLLKKHKVETIEGKFSLFDYHTLRVIHPDSAQTYSFNNAIIATGSRPIEIPGFKFGGRVLDYWRIGIERSA